MPRRTAPKNPPAGRWTIDELDTVDSLPVRVLLDGDLVTRFNTTDEAADYVARQADELPDLELDELPTIDDPATAPAP